MTQAAFELLIVSAGGLVTLATYFVGFVALCRWARRCNEREISHVRNEEDVQ